MKVKKSKKYKFPQKEVHEGSQKYMRAVRSGVRGF
jgi:hypothetical protein